MKLGYMLNSSTLKPSTPCNLQTDVCEIPIKLPLSVYRDYRKGDLSTHLANLPATLQQQLELRRTERFKA